MINAALETARVYEHHISVGRWCDGKRIGFQQSFHTEREALEFAAQLAQSEGLATTRIRWHDKRDLMPDGVVVEEVCLLNPRTAGRAERVFDMDGRRTNVWPS